LRHSNHNTHWACFAVFANHVDIIAIVGPNRTIHRTNASRAQARTIWAELLQEGWRRASDQEVLDHQMSYRRLLDLAYGPKG